MVRLSKDPQSSFVSLVAWTLNADGSLSSLQMNDWEPSRNVPNQRSVNMKFRVGSLFSVCGPDIDFQIPN